VDTSSRSAYRPTAARPRSSSRALLHEAGVPLLGTSFDGLDLAENRSRWRDLVTGLGLRQPESRIASTREDSLASAEQLGYPVLVRPSYVLGGRGMRVVYDRSELEDWLLREVLVSVDEPVLIDKFLEGALEVDVDAVADGESVLVVAVMEHIEEAGIHSGDSTCVIPPFTLGESTVAEVRAITARLARALGVRGLMNVQYAVRLGEIYVLEANPRASRTVPFVSKAVGLPLARLAARHVASAGRHPAGRDRAAHSAPKPVLPFSRFPEDAPWAPR
jgi:carbamoyl-phosphate synthase large subunit